MKIREEPRWLAKISEEIASKAWAELQMEPPTNREEAYVILKMLPQHCVSHLAHLKERSLERGQFLSRVGHVYGSALSEIIGWQLVYMTDDVASEDDGWNSLVDPDRAYVFNHLTVVHFAFRGDLELLEAVCEIMTTKQLPSVQPNAFLEITPVHYESGAIIDFPLPPAEGQSLSASQVAQKISAELGVSLPEEFVSFVEFAESVPQKSFFWVVPNDWGSAISTLYSLKNDGANSSLLTHVNVQTVGLAEKLYPIGDDGNGGTLLLSLAEKSYGQIYYSCPWSDHETVKCYNGFGYWKIAESFMSFLQNLEENLDED